MALEKIQTHISQLEKVQSVDQKNADQINQILAQTDTELAQLKSAQEKTQAYNLILPQIQKLKDSIKPAQKSDPKIWQLSDRIVAFEAKIWERWAIMADINAKTWNVEEIRNQNWIRGKLRWLANIVVTPLGIDNFDLKSWVPDWENHKNNNPIQNFSMWIIDYFVDMPAVVEDIIKNPELLKSLWQALIKMFSINWVKELFNEFMADVKWDAYHKGRAFIDLLLTITWVWATLKWVWWLAKASAQMQKITAKEIKLATQQARKIAKNEWVNNISTPSIPKKTVFQSWAETTWNILLKTWDKFLIPWRFFSTLPFEKLKNYFSSRKNINWTWKISQELDQINNDLNKTATNLEFKQQRLYRLEQTIAKLQNDFNQKFKSEILSWSIKGFDIKMIVWALEMWFSKPWLLTDFRKLADKVKHWAPETEIDNFLKNNDWFPIKQLGENYKNLSFKDKKELIISMDDTIENFMTKPDIRKDLTDIRLTFEMKQKIQSRVLARRDELKSQLDSLETNIPNKTKDIIISSLKNFDEKKLKWKEIVLEMKNWWKYFFVSEDIANWKLVLARYVKWNWAVLQNWQNWVIDLKNWKIISNWKVIDLSEAQNIFTQNKKVSSAIVDEKLLQQNWKNLLDTALNRPSSWINNRWNWWINWLKEYEKWVWQQALLSAKWLSIMQKQAQNLSKFFSSYWVWKEFEIFSAWKSIKIKRLPSNIKTWKPIFEVNWKKWPIEIKPVVDKNWQIPRTPTLKPKWEMDIKLPDWTRFRVEADALIWKQNWKNFQISRYSKLITWAWVATWWINIMNRNFDAQMTKELEASIKSYENWLATWIFDSKLDWKTNSTSWNSQNQDSISKPTWENVWQNSVAESNSNTSWENSTNTTNNSWQDSDFWVDSQDSDTNIWTEADWKTIFDLDVEDFWKKKDLSESQKNQLLNLLKIDISSAKNFLTNAKSSSVRLVPENINWVDYDQEKFVQQTYKMFDAQREKFVDFKHNWSEKKLFLQPWGWVHLDLSKISYLKQDWKTYYFASVSESSKMRWNYVILWVQQWDNFKTSLDFWKKQSAEDPASNLDKTKENNSTTQSTSKDTHPEQNIDYTSISPKQNLDISELVNVKNNLPSSSPYTTKYELSVYDNNWKLKSWDKSYGDLEKDWTINFDQNANVVIGQNKKISLDINNMKKSKLWNEVYYFALISSTGTSLDWKYVQVAKKKSDWSYETNIN